jgi:hypothetical protein
VGETAAGYPTNATVSTDRSIGSIPIRQRVGGGERIITPPSSSRAIQGSRKS